VFVYKPPDAVSSKPCSESLPQIAPEILHIFKPDGKPHKGIADAAFFAFLRGHGRVRHGGRVAQYALNAAQAHRDERKSDALQKFLCQGWAFQFKGKNSPRTA
jgi:hypothetical protein